MHLHVSHCLLLQHRLPKPLFFKNVRHNPAIAEGEIVEAGSQAV